jgi:hypothetical protein
MNLIANYLEDEIKRELRQRSLIIWLDKDGHYTEFVDTLIQRYQQGDFFAPVVAFRGSYLDMLFALEPYGNGEDADRILIHMPGHTEETIRQTPILELYFAGTRFRKALPALIREATTGLLTPNQIETYLSQPSLNLSAAEQWLTQSRQQQAPQTPTGTAIAQYLSSLSLEWILEGLLDLRPEFKARVQTIHLPDLAEHLHRHTGLSDDFRQFYLGPNHSLTRLSDLGEAFAAWLLCVEYVHDLSCPPHVSALQPLRQLSAPLRSTCQRLIQHLRQKHPDTYEPLALSTEGHLDCEISQITPEDLGTIDTFRWEENTILNSALRSLANSHWHQVLAVSQPRSETPSFWLSRDPVRALEWSLIHRAAQFGTILRAESELLRTSATLSEALTAYTQTGYRVDQAHRGFEQQRAKLLESSLPHFSDLLAAADVLRSEYRAWADTLTDRFCQLCDEQGFLPESNLQQRSLFDQVIYPLTQTLGGQSPTPVAYFLIDAFRYEMAAELKPELEGNGIQVHLDARYAELPTITAVGMNLLAPVNQGGKLSLSGKDNQFGGFKAGEYTVKDPKTRERAMGDRSVGKHSTVMLTLDEVGGFDNKMLTKKCDKAKLIIIHSKEIDDAGEANVGPLTFEELLKQIKSACNRLRSIGINELVLTADHGFLLQEETFTSTDFGTVRTPERRYAFFTHPERTEQTIPVSLEELGYEGRSGYLIFRRDTQTFNIGRKGAKFVHGGNSLQERVIPVLSISSRQPMTANLVHYRIDLETKANLFDMQRVEVRIRPVETAQGVLDFTNPKTKIAISLRVPDRPDIQVKIKHVTAADLNNQQSILNQQVILAPQKDWAEILFDLTGPRDERIQLEVYHPDALENVEAALSKTFFQVSGTPPPKEGSESLSPPIEPSSLTSTNWSENLEDEGIRRVFLHLEIYGAISETELVQMLGNARKVRQFAMSFEAYLQNVPFSVRIEANASGKRYVKDMETS